MVGLLGGQENRDSSELVKGMYTCGAYGLWSDWSAHRNNKVMQQKQRSKFPKSWMFKYKRRFMCSA